MRPKQNFRTTTGQKFFSQMKLLPQEKDRILSLILQMHCSGKSDAFPCLTQNPKTIQRFREGELVWKLNRNTLLLCLISTIQNEQQNIKRMKLSRLSLALPVTPALTTNQSACPLPCSFLGMRKILPTLVMLSSKPSQSQTP